jgi:hypothetical protein
MAPPNNALITTPFCGRENFRIDALSRFVLSVKEKRQGGYRTISVVL